MDALREQLNKPVVGMVASFLLGLFIGLVVLGWWIWPVEWKDAGPEHLRLEYQEDYLRTAMDSYAQTGDLVAAQARVASLGEDAGPVLQRIQADPRNQDPAVINTFVSLVGVGPVAGSTPPPGEAQPTPTIPVGAETQVAGGTPPAAPGTTAPGGVMRSLLPVLCAVTVLLGGTLVALFFLRGRLSGMRLPTPSARRVDVSRQTSFTDYDSTGQEPPIAQFMTTYTLGSDLYDDSFSIDSHTGEFLGECGVGISETISVGEPKRVSAFEVWLFDKNDIQTVTKVLMSRHLYADEGARHRLSAKGEPVLAEPGREIVLETATLTLVARVVDLSYGASALPTDSFFERMTLDLMVWPK